jgi:soluble lytic murein transglycosylase-like protein
MADEYGVDARLAHALIRVESNYQADAVSPKGAMGLMQLMPATARQYSVANPFDPEQNLAGGLRHLRGLLDRYGRGRESLALAAYNAGEGAVSKYQGIPPYRETRNYVERIMTLVRQ